MHVRLCECEGVTLCGTVCIAECVCRSVRLSALGPNSVPSGGLYAGSREEVSGRAQLSWRPPL